MGGFCFWSRIISLYPDYYHSSKGHLPIALAGIGFKLDQRYTGDFGFNVTGLHLSLVHTHDGRRHVLTSTPPEALQAEALTAPKELVVNAGVC